MLDTLLGLTIRYGTPRQRRVAQRIARWKLSSRRRLWAARRALGKV
jgi:hypothetical protein